MVLSEASATPLLSAGKWTVMAEYDSEGFNVGAAARLWRHLSIHVFTREFNSISGGIRYECRLLH